MSRSVVDSPCYLNEPGGDHFEDPDYERSCDGCWGDPETCAIQECSCSCHYDREPDEPEPDDDED